jgi:hypothetical protein
MKFLTRAGAGSIWNYITAPRDIKWAQPVVFSAQFQPTNQSLHHAYNPGAIVSLYSASCAGVGSAS